MAPLFCSASPLIFGSSNTNAIAIQDSLTPPTKGAPYPSTNIISVPAGLVVGKVSVTIQGLTHNFPSDVSMLLVGPRGQQTILMSEVGGQTELSVTNLTLTFDDDAAAPLPVYTRLTSGAYRPTNGYLVMGYPRLPYDFPAPAPAGSSNAPVSLSVFTNTDPNGTWSLYVVSDASGDTGSIAGGWSINVQVGTPLWAVRSGANMILSWTNTVAGCTLQTTPSLSLPFTNVPTPPVVLSGRYTVTNPITAGSRLYRLIH